MSLSSKPVYVTTSAESRELDRIAIADFGLAGLVLMETAARSIFSRALDFWPDLQTRAQKILVLAGPGQNGGDGWVLARLFSSLGHPVDCFLVGKPGAEPKGDAAPNFALAKKLNLSIRLVQSDDDPLPTFSDYDLVVDAIFGTGLDRPLTGQAARTLKSAQAARRSFRVLAVDICSGLSGDAGTAGPEVLPADLTVSLGTFKWGHFLQDGPALSGELQLGDIGLCPAMLEQAGLRARLLDASLAKTFVPPRPKHGHKGSFGHCLMVGGSPGKTGAVVLSTLGAQRSGCGLITAGHPASLSGVMEAKLTSAMTLSLPEDSQGGLSFKAAEPILDFMSKAQALGLGPGLGLGEEQKELTLRLISTAAKPMVIDADALTNLVGRLEELKKVPWPRVLTPHPGEAARLLGSTSAEVQADRPSAAAALAEKSGAIVVLKGSNTLLAAPSGEILVNSVGGPVLAAGGSGDLLAGLVAGLLAQNAPPLAAAALGVFLHGLAGDVAASRLADRGVLPTEIQACLPEAWKKVLGSGTDNATYA
ncbi:MAG: NAD(P)H-hydrate dehydratase [Deltaproteobacteria bacterium]|jgi:NAD(P)H-hydrate epimerase|nr:NAD(P)H-hydrate dehydratase [Deltaproteobacteria bacterium]